MPLIYEAAPSGLKLCRIHCRTQCSTFDEWPFNGLMTHVIVEKIMLESERKKAEAKDGVAREHMATVQHEDGPVHSQATGDGDKDERVAHPSV